MKKHFVIIFTVFVQAFLSAQNIQFRLHPLDDSSEHREKYKSLFTSGSYAISLERSFKSIRFETDTSFLVIRDSNLFTKKVEGKSFLKIVDVESGTVLFSQLIRIIKQPQVLIVLVENSLKKGKVKIKIVDDKRKSLKRKYKLGYADVRMIDSNGKYIYSVAIKEYKTSIDKINLNNIASYEIEGLVILKENGLAVSIKKSKNKIIKNNNR